LFFPRNTRTQITAIARIMSGQVASIGMGSPFPPWYAKAGEINNPAFSTAAKSTKSVVLRISTCRVEP
ncbi:MAG: hypothetical protein O7D31_03035, partial [Alphaproteobacteria bacterium]|nr:hypothetical protein [Alphaproteobacteria bacterium]